MCQYYLRKHCSVILLQMIMVSPGTHLAKKKLRVQVQNHWVPVQKTMTHKLIFGGPLCNHADNLSEDKFQNWSKLCATVKWNKKTPSIVKQQLQEQPQKSHELDILQKHLQFTDRSLHCTGRMPWIIILRLWHFLCIRDAGCGGNKITDCCCCFLVNGYLKALLFYLTLWSINSD